MALYSAATEDAGYELNRLIGQAAVVGSTETALARAAPGLWDRGAALRVRIGAGEMSSATEPALLAGANLAAIGSGAAGLWELFQFRDAVLVSPGIYELSMRLRGQLGTDAVAPESWPVGSRLVLIDAGLTQIDLALAARGLARNYRVGPAQRSYDDPSFLHLVEAFDGVGLRPYAPAHLRAVRESSGALSVNWVRRTRIGGDSWASEEVPLGEAREEYRVRVVQAGTVLRVTSVALPSWTYSSAQQSLDGVLPGHAIDVAQVSETFGPGPFTRITIDD